MILTISILYLGLCPRCSISSSMSSRDPNAESSQYSRFRQRTGLYQHESMQSLVNAIDGNYILA